MCFGLFDVELFPLQLELIFLVAHFICPSRTWFGKSLLMKIFFNFFSEEKIVLGRDMSLAWYITFLIIAILY